MYDLPQDSIWGDPANHTSTIGMISMIGMRPLGPSQARHLKCIKAVIYPISGGGWPAPPRSETPSNISAMSIEPEQHNRNLMWTKSEKARLILIFCTNTNYEHMTNRSFRFEKCLARGVRKVTAGFTGLWQPSSPKGGHRTEHPLLLPKVH